MVKVGGKRKKKGVSGEDWEKEEMMIFFMLFPHTQNFQDW